MTPKRRPRRRGWARRIADDVAMGGAALGSDQRPEIDALFGLDAELGDPEDRRGLLDRVPGWVLIAVVLVVFLLAVFVHDWQ
jgi:hypothetical protein